MIKIKDIELNSKFKQALDLIEAGENVFITGKAGTGKSTLLRYFRAKSQQKMAVLAPTGVAAFNVQGQTIHSFFGFGPDITLEKIKKKYRSPRRAKLYKNLETLVIDEISMVRADLLDCVAEFLEMNGPDKGQLFGGVQMIFFGDLYQLPPVVTGVERKLFKEVYQSPYFFDSYAFSKNQFELVHLEKIYRQEDQDFIRVLNAVRNKTVTSKHLSLLNQQVLNQQVGVGSEPDQAKLTQPIIHLTTTNAKARRINQYYLDQLDGKEHVYDGILIGDLQTNSLPAPTRLKLKVGTQVMLVSNDQADRWVNGTVGRVVDILPAQDQDEVELIVVKTRDGQVVEVGPHTWERFEYRYNQKLGRLETETVGSFSQYPLILAWAITIHKSQGKTFEQVVLDLGRGSFAHGQTYVALSRCTSLAGLNLTRPLRKKDILTDWRVAKFMADYQHYLAGKEMTSEKKAEILREAVANETKVKLVYLKSNDAKSERSFLPSEVGTMEYHGKQFLGVRGFCFLRQSERVFRVDRILELEVNNAE